MASVTVAFWDGLVMALLFGSGMFGDPTLDSGSYLASMISDALD